MRGYGSLRGASILLVDNILEVLDGKFPEADLQQRAHQRPHHVAQETVRGDGEDELVIHAVPVRLRNVADEVIDLRVHFRETGKVLVLKE